MKTKIMLLFSLLVVGSMVLTACGGAATQPPAATQAPATQAPATQAPAATEAPTQAATEAPAAAAEVTIWHSYHTGGSEEAALTKLVNQYQTDHPNVKVNVLAIPFDQIFNKYETDTAAGGGPDMF